VLILAEISLLQNSQGWFLAVNVIVVGVLLSGLAIGIGTAFRSRRLWAWGVEELAQAVVNAAMLGILLAWIASVDTATYSFVDMSSLHCPALNISANNSSNLPLQYSRCSLSQIQDSTIPIISSLSSLSYKLGWLSGLTVSVDIVQSRPFSSFADLSSEYSKWASKFASFLSSSYVLLQFLSLVSSSVAGVFLPAGLLLRMFFATRKIGGAIMAASIGFYVIFPLAYASLANPGPVISALSATSDSISKSFSYLEPVPIIDLGKSGEVSMLISSLSGGQLPYTSAEPYQFLAAASASMELALFYYPLVALAITAVAIRELYLILGAEFNLSLFKMVKKKRTKRQYPRAVRMKFKPRRALFHPCHNCSGLRPPASR
jgi:hypothetical protein